MWLCPRRKSLWPGRLSLTKQEQQQARDADALAAAAAHAPYLYSQPSVQRLFTSSRACPRTSGGRTSATLRTQAGSRVGGDKAPQGATLQLSSLAHAHLVVLRCGRASLAIEKRKIGGGMPGAASRPGSPGVASCWGCMARQTRQPPLIRAPRCRVGPPHACTQFNACSAKTRQS